MSARVQVQSVAVITQAVTDLLLNDADIGLAGTLVERAGEANKEPKVVGWVGVYRSQVTYRSRVLGIAPGFRAQRVELLLEVQESDPESGAKCEDRLEALVARVAGALFSDPSLRGTVQTIDPEADVVVRYTRYERTDAGYVQSAFLFLTAIALPNIIYS